MKKSIAVVSFLIASQSVLAMAGVSVDVNIGVPRPQPPVVVAPPPPVMYQQPPEVVYESQPRFIFSPALGFYVSVDVPYDIVYIGNRYYLYNGGFWYAGPSYNGPWAVTKRRFMPRELKRFRYEQIRSYRDAEYRVYQRDPAHYHGRMHEPAWQHREHRREEMREQHRGEMRGGERRDDRR